MLNCVKIVNGLIIKNLIEIECYYLIFVLKEKWLVVIEMTCELYPGEESCKTCPRYLDDCDGNEDEL